MCCMHVVFLCFMKLSLLVLCSCCMLVVKKIKHLLYFSARVTCSDILCYIFSAHGIRTIIIVLYFLRVERALALICYIRTLYGVIMLYFSVCGMRSGVIVLYFQHVERALALLCYIFCLWNALWRYCVNFFAFGTSSVILC